MLHPLEMFVRSAICAGNYNLYIPPLYFDKTLWQTKNEYIFVKYNLDE